MRKDEVHIGKLIRSKLKEKGLSAHWLARQIPYTRNNIYKIFDQEDIHPRLLKRISKILNFNFFGYYSESVRKEIEEKI